MNSWLTPCLLSACFWGQSVVSNKRQRRLLDEIVDLVRISPLQIVRASFLDGILEYKIDGSIWVISETDLMASRKLDDPSYAVLFKKPTNPYLLIDNFRIVGVRETLEDARFRIPLFAEKSLEFEREKRIQSYSSTLALILLLTGVGVLVRSHVPE